MIKQIIFTLVLLLYFEAAFPQNTAPALQQVALTPPSIREFEKYTNYDVGLQNGVASFSVPIYTVNIGKLSIPITLTYHASGIKYRQRSNDVGAGWVLSPLFEVSRTVYDRPDENFPMPDVSNTYLTSFDLTNNFPGRDAFLSSFGNQESDAPISTNGLNDSEFDVFNYNIGSDAGSFIIKDRNTKEVRQISKNTTRISYQQDNDTDVPPGIKYFNIIDGNGLIYEMGRVAGTNEALYGVSNYALGSAITSWYASKITDPFGNSVKLSYTNGTESEDTTYPKYLYMKQGVLNPFVGDGIVDHGAASLSGGHSTGYTVKQITNISTINENVTFYRSSGGVDNGGRIDSIRVTTGDGRIIKRVVFHYVGAGVHTLLDYLTVMGSNNAFPEKYGFTYYPGPAGVESHRDYWGYYADNNFTDNNFPPFADYDMSYPVYSLGSLIDRQNMDNIALTPNYYSLKRIDLPTGGYREFEYEPHQYLGYSETNKTTQTKNMGIRIKRIKSNDGINSVNTLIQDYKYGLNENGLTALITDDMARVYWFAYDGPFIHIENDGSNPVYYSYRNYSSTNPYLGTFETLLPVYYPQVTVYQTKDENIYPVIYNGKTEYYFEREGKSQSLFYPYAQNPAELSGFDSYHVGSYDLWNQPFASETKYYVNSGSNYKLLKDEQYLYTLNNRESFTGLHVKKFARAYPQYIPSLKDSYYSQTRSFFSYANYVVSCAANVLIRKILIANDVVSGASTTDTTNYVYNDLNQITSTISCNSNSDTITVTNKYPIDYNITGTVTDNTAKGIQFLKTANILTPIIEQTTFKKGRNGLRAVISSAFTSFKPTQPVPDIAYYTESTGAVSGFVQTNVNSSGTTMHASYKSRYQFLFDNYGNLVQQQKINGVSETYLWGYNSRYPVAKITGGTFINAQSLISQSLLDNTSVTDSQMRAELNKLRNGVPGSEVSTYTYDPLIGMTSSTDPKGETTYYEYDNFQRLMNVKDKDGNIIKSYCYNYTGQNGCQISSIPQVGNGVATRTLMRQCGTGYAGSSVTYTVPANTYYAANQAAADQLAQNDLNANAQNYANVQGSCTLVCTGNAYKVINNICEQGNKVYTKSGLVSGHYVCVYHYEWSDGSYSADYSENSPTACAI